MVLSVISPAGTMSHTARGALSLPTISLERGGGLRAVLFQQRAGGLRRIVAHDFMAAAHQTLRHIRAHPAETDHCDFHTLQPCSRERITPSISRIRGV